MGAILRPFLLAVLFFVPLGLLLKEAITERLVQEEENELLFYVVT